MTKEPVNIQKKWTNETYVGANGKKSLIDLSIPSNFDGDLVIFIHGYMGFKDWGCWSLVEDYFLRAGKAFCKYNVSHNGCSIEHPEDFVDLEAFGRNTYTKELADLNAVVEWIKSKEIGGYRTHLIGHSRGGGIALLAGNVIDNISSITTWAAISDIEKRFPKEKDLEDWKESGVRIQKNGRTKQELPLFYAQFEDFQVNKEKLNIEESVKKLQQPLLIIHGTEDTSVLLEEGENIARWSGKELTNIPNTAHTFDSKHPWNEEEMPLGLSKVCKLALDFINKNHG